MKQWIWAIVLMGGVFEAVWALCMDKSHGFTNILWTIATIGFIFTSVSLLNIGLKRGVPVGGGYAVWVGVGTICSIVLGIIIANDPFLLSRLLFAAIIIVGIVGVELSCGSNEVKAAPDPDAGDGSD
ncbi:MAG: SMR family transporter [Methanomassiliicoccaceae archaeon]|nr:SMR family transporter [Methanomassiliicoccaceae archaeon]